MDIDKEKVKQLRNEGKEDRYIAWMLGCRVEDLPEPEEEELEFDAQENPKD